jgi:hypothetical protein
MLDLRALTEEFIQNQWEIYAQENPADETVIEALNGNGSDRVEKILTWLRHYKVHRAFSPDNFRNVATQIELFAQNRSTRQLDQCEASVLSEFNKLEALIRPLAPLNKDGEARKVISLTSKALWFCYPYDVPIFDGYAERALQVIARITSMTPKQSGTSYACFLDIWFQVYAVVSPVIDQANLNGYPYKVRVLDRLLWHLGQPDFATPPLVQPAQTP